MPAACATPSLALALRRSTGSGRRTWSARGRRVVSMSPCPGPISDATSPGSRRELLPGLVRARVRPTRRTKADAEPVAEVDPVARVLVDVPLAHLDRTFDYGVPASMAEGAQPGVRVKVRFAGRDVDGFVLERVAGTDHAGSLTPLRRVVSAAEPVLSPQVAVLAAELAERYAGTRSDVLRLAVPGRHAATEKKDSVACGAPPRPTTPARPRLPGLPTRPRLRSSGTWPTAGRRGRSGAPPPAPTGRPVAHAVAATIAGGRGALVVVPDGKDVAQVDAALTAVLGADQHVVLTADAGPAKRYRDFLAVARGRRRVVVGTRAAAFAPDRGPRPGGDLGRRRRPARRAAGSIPARPRDPAAACRARGGGRARGGLRDERRGRAAGPHGLGAPARRLPRGAAGPPHGLRRGCRRARAGQGSPRPGHPDADRGAPRDSRRADHRAGARADPAQRATPPPSPASAAAPRLAAGSAPARWRSARPPRRRPAGGAVRRRGLGLRRVRPPRPARAGRRGGPHRGGARPVVRRHRGPHLGRRPGAGHRSTTSRPSWWPRRVPSRWPPVATRPSSCSTPGWCSAWPTCAPRRRRCAAGPTPSPWSAPAVARWWSAIRPTPPSRPWCAGTRPGSPPARPSNAARRTCRPRPGSRPSPASPARSTTR